jgi:hypothetical protein
MTQDDQDILCSINARHRTLYHDELARHLFQATGNCYSARQIRQCMFRKGYVYKKASHLAPIERDLEFRRFWREQVIYPGGAIRAEHLLFVDELASRNHSICFVESNSSISKVFILFVSYSDKSSNLLQFFTIITN